MLTIINKDNTSSIKCDIYSKLAAPIKRQYQIVAEKSLSLSDTVAVLISSWCDRADYNRGHIL